MTMRSKTIRCKDGDCGHSIMKHGESGLGVCRIKNCPCAGFTTNHARARRSAPIASCACSVLTGACVEHMEQNRIASSVADTVSEADEVLGRVTLLPYPEKLGHNFYHGQCQTCGLTMPEYTRAYTERGQQFASCTA